MPAQQPPSSFESSDAYALIERIVAECPQRLATSSQELAAQQILAEEFHKCGFQSEFRPFRYSRSVLAVVSLHFGLAALACLCYLWSPALAFALQAVVLVSYVGESTRLYAMLRRLLPYGNSQNLLATLPATEPMKARIVLLAHVDAAQTGWIFNSSLGCWIPRGPIRRAFMFAVIGLVVVMSIGVRASTSTLMFPWTYPTYLFWALYFSLLAILGAEIAWRNRVVPGANDNLSGCAVLVGLATRIAASKPGDVELVLGITGCEEAGTGGALALVRQMREQWDRENTYVVAVDTVGHGQLQILQEGEIIPIAPSKELKRVALETAEQQQLILGTFNQPVGATDALPFLVRRYQSICIAAIDPQLGMPRNYHQMSDSPENLDYEFLMKTVDFIEQYVRNIAAMDTPPAARVAQAAKVHP